ncbi:UNKNOWN [Stylonychia lemnae]|uniref:Uncharacterized protein n=1 Tax=Stylonychia lemnae TaxID=5949 RepID=A0A077ZW30_STYLE|nr:UNKNOWN [Stylonychia lemnae]|eukprot:CDW74160.1 UNKNOWN [Stylonychia lemnae]
MNKSYTSDFEEQKQNQNFSNRQDKDNTSIKEVIIMNKNKRNIDSLRDESEKSPLILQIDSNFKQSDFQTKLQLSTQNDHTSEQLQRSSMGNNKTWFNDSDQFKIKSQQTLNSMDKKDEFKSRYLCCC